MWKNTKNIFLDNKSTSNKNKENFISYIFYIIQFLIELFNKAKQYIINQLTRQVQEGRYITHY